MGAMMVAHQGSCSPEPTARAVNPDDSEAPMSRTAGVGVGRLVLIVEDEAPISELLRFHLAHQGFACECLADGREALARVMAQPYDLIVLDLSLPGLDGLSLCRELRAGGPNQHVPLLMLTARGEEADKVVGFESGADDYLSKPFGVREFMARAAALLRRREAWRAAPAGDARRPIAIGGVAIDPAKRRVAVGEVSATLTPHEFDLLYLLASNPGVVFTREALLENVWQHEVFVTERGVDTLIKRLRRKIEPDPAHPRFVLTARGTGYKFGE